MRKVRRSKKCVSSAACPRSVVAIYDRGEGVDRFTVVFDLIYYTSSGMGYLDALCMNSCGDYFHWEAEVTYRKGYGKSIAWEELPGDCRRAIVNYLTKN